MKQRSGSLRMNKIDKSLTKLTKRKRKKTQINKIRDEKRNFITKAHAIQRVIKEYFENLYSNKLKNLEEIDTFLDRYDYQS
jgi:hypothetical protein